MVQPTEDKWIPSHWGNHGAKGDVAPAVGYTGASHSEQLLRWRGMERQQKSNALLGSQRLADHLGGSKLVFSTQASHEGRWVCLSKLAAAHWLLQLRTWRNMVSATSHKQVLGDKRDQWLSSLLISHGGTQESSYSFLGNISGHAWGWGQHHGCIINHDLEPLMFGKQ